MTFERTRDLDLVRSILIHPAVWRHVVDDASPAPAEFLPHDHPGIWYVLAKDSAGLAGLFMFAPQNAACYEIHAAMLPEAWGPRAAEAGRKIFGWMWRHSPARRIVASAPAYNRLVIRYAEASGMKRFGTNERSFPRGGRLYDQILLGISPS